MVFITNGSQDRTHLIGMFWMVLTSLQFVAVTGIVKHLGPVLPAAESGFLRYLMGLVFVIPAIRAISRAKLSRSDLATFGLRGTLHAIGVILWFFAMTRISMAEVTAMNYLTPVFVTLGAAMFLRERLALPRVLAICVALLGAMIILRPGLREISSAHIAMLGTAVTFATSYVITKTLVSRFEPVVIVAMLSIVVSIVMAPIAISVWVTPTADQLAWLFLVACFATGAHYTMTLAFRAAPMTVTQPLAFLQLVWASILGVVVFGEQLDPFVVAGGVVIFASVTFITYRESLRKKAG